MYNNNKKVIDDNSNNNKNNAINNYLSIKNDSFTCLKKKRDESKANCIINFHFFFVSFKFALRFIFDYKMYM